VTVAPDTSTVALPRQRGAHRRAAGGWTVENVGLQLAPEPVTHRLVPQVAAPDRRRVRVSPAVHGAAAAAYTLASRAGSLATLAAVLVLGGTVAMATDGTPAGSLPGATPGTTAGTVDTATTLQLP
jgi:hypothetical protein